jgi:hypothetical protein
MSKPKLYDFSGWATKNDLRCSDGRTIRKDAFKDDDGRRVPLVWMHQHNDPENVLGHAILENRDEGVYAYCSFNDTHPGQQAKELVRHGDVCSLSIFANNLTQENGNVLHGSIKEVSVVLAGANPGAVIDFPMLAHGEGEEMTQATIRVDEPIELYHSEEAAEPVEEETPAEQPAEEETVEHADSEKPEEKKERTVQDVLDGMTEEKRKVTEFLVEQAIASRENGGEEVPEETAAHADNSGERTVQDVLDEMTDEEKTVVEYLVAQALDGAADDIEGEETAEHSDNEGEELEMNNVFENANEKKHDAVLSHADGVDMINYAREHGMSLRQLLLGWAQENEKDTDSLSHSDLGINDVAQLFPDYKLINGPSPELMTTDQGWIGKVMAKVKKSPVPRLRVRFADVRDISGRRAKGYKKGTQKDLTGNVDLLGRTSDPITVYVSTKLDRDDIIDITDFDYVAYMYNLDRMNLNEELARQIMIGDGRTGDKAIDADKIRPIWTDDDLFTIHTKVDVAGMRTTMNGTNSSANFGDNYVYAEAVIQSLLYAREQYKGSGNPDFYCTPHLVNIMLLARDLNGRRIYDNISELTAALNVNSIITCEQFAGKTRVHDAGKVTQETRELLGIMVNLSDYTIGAAKGGQITHFTDFDIRFNQELSLLETRCSGMLTRPYSAIALEVAANPQ